MADTAHPVDPELEAERRLLEAAVAEARANPGRAAPHESVRAEMLREINRLKRKIAAR
jgi:hypothetical protein